MDSTELIIDYSVQDYQLAIRQLLPKGEYWQQADNAELTAMIEGMATDFKITHDETILSLSNFKDKDLFGWKLSDYQRMLNETHTGVVSDDYHQPNLIIVTLNNESLTQDIINKFDQIRLPHTEFQWLTNVNAKTEISVTSAGTLSHRLEQALQLESTTKINVTTVAILELKIT